jgi:hypothetical protein
MLNYIMLATCTSNIYCQALAEAKKHAYMQG